MNAVKISLNSTDKVKSFCNDIAKFDAEREAAGIVTDTVSPKLLPDYRGNKSGM